MRALVAILLAAALAAACGDARVRSDRSTVVRDLIEGVYGLTEAHVGEEVVRPPRISGRFVLSKGVVVTILHYRLTNEEQTSTTQFGSYVLDAGHFGYRYDDPMVTVISRGTTAVSRAAPWQGMREFKINVEGRAVRLQTQGAMQELLFSPEGLTYSENGRVQRVWRRFSEASR